MKIMNLNKKFFSIVSKQVYQDNKNFAARFRDSKSHNLLYDRNLMNITQLLYLVKKPFEKIIFIGPNPDIFLTSLPWSM
jgi:hypothetical protein